METMQTIQSRDGVDIACWISGHGPNLVLVHGVSADHTRWPQVLPRLEEHFTVCAVDRRGRGGSGDSPDYSIEREFDDIAAVCDSFEAPVHLLGHSYGGVCTLGAALRSSNIDKLILYEPSIDLGQPLAPPDAIRRMEEMIEQGDLDGAMVTLFRDVVEVPEPQIATLRADASWQGRLASAHTIVRELSAEIPAASHFRDVTTPTLLLTGEISPRVEIDSARAVHDALPNSRIVEMPGQGHIAMTTAPDLLVDEIERFLLEPRGG